MKLKQDKGQICSGSVSLRPPNGEREQLRLYMGVELEGRKAHVKDFTPVQDFNEWKRDFYERQVRQKV